MTDTVHDMSLMLGKLEAQINYLTEAARSAVQARKVTYRKLELISRQISAAEIHIQHLEQRIDAVEKPMLQIQRWQERGLGAVMLIGLACTLIGGTITNYWQKIIAFLRF